MDKEVLSLLVDREIVNHNTQVTAMVKGSTFNGTDAYFEKDIYYYKGINPRAIKYIEGMTPERFAKAYNIKTTKLKSA